MGKNRRFFGTYIIKVGVWRWHWGGWTATTYKTPVFNLLSDDCFRRCWPVWRCRPAASSRTARRPWPVLRGSPPAVESMCRSHSAEERKNMKLQRTKFDSHLHIRTSGWFKCWPTPLSFSRLRIFNLHLILAGLRTSPGRFHFGVWSRHGIPNHILAYAVSMHQHWFALHSSPHE